MNTKIRIEGMTCGGCVRSVQGVLGRLPGIARADVEVGRAAVEYDERKIRREQIVAAIEAAGFRVAPEGA